MTSPRRGSSLADFVAEKGEVVTLFGPNGSIIEFQLIQQKLAEMAQLIDISRLAVYRAHLILDEYIKGAVEPRTMAAISSITKVFVTENATKVIEHAIQILGGSGYMEEYDVERIWRDH